MTPTEIPEDATAEDAYKLARPFIVRDYRRWVKQAAEEILQENPETKEQGELEDAVHEVVDGSYWTTYTYASLLAIIATDNDDAFIEDYGADALVARDRDGDLLPPQVYARLAYGALEVDLREELRRQLGERDGA